MGRKRKARAVEAPVEPESVPLNEAKPEQLVVEEIQETVEEDPLVDEGADDEVNEEQEGEVLVDGEERLEQENDVEFVKDVQESKVTEEQLEKVVSEIDREAEGEEEGDEEGLEDESLEDILEYFSKDQITRLIKEAVDKYPDVLECVNSLANADPSHRKIFVHGLGWDANSELITSVFGKYGEIEDCKVVMDKNSGKAKGYAFILFKDRNGARRSLKMPQKMIEGRTTSCQLASAGPVQAPPSAMLSSVSESFPSEYAQRKIFVSNVSAEVDVTKLVELFSKFGEIEEGPLGLDKETGKARGFCLFVYKSIESAKKALEDPHKKFEGQILHCQKAVDGPKFSKAPLNLPHGLPLQEKLRPQLQNQHQFRYSGQQGHYNHSAKRGRHGGSRGGTVHPSGHLMAPGPVSNVPSVGFNHAAPPAVIEQAVAAILATQGAGLGIGNLLGGIGAGVYPQVGSPMVNNAVYGGQSSAGSYGMQPGMQGSYGGPPHMGQGGAWPHQGGAPYLGHGH